MTSALLGAALALLGPMVTRLAAHRESVDQQQWATAELNNVLEDYAGRPYDAVTTDAGFILPSDVRTPVATPRVGEQKAIAVN